ncbi:oxidoreductase [Pseudodesulfovibrio tunisiensis]|uniref:oxidoreductase n=1 Tax=Pseudodesulfovibrio tunisiensis TaxID=463192 RepID=UPI001FB42922|nr:oxidoreductase [Pseudodesulfovibrio tunisiensis]
MENITQGETKMGRSSNKVALVTGASSGMGRDIAKKLLKDGATVYVVARRVEQMHDLESLGAKALKMDITKEEDILAVVRKIGKDHGGVDILVNSAGFGMYGAMEETTIDDARYQFEVNLFGLARLTQLVLPAMREKRSGKIINISSVGGKVHTPLGSWYHATKYALEGWSDSLRIEVEQFGIDVVIIEPGAIKSEFADVMTGPMVKRSGKGPYRKMVEGLIAATREAEAKGRMSAPGVITNLVMKAVHARRPKTRYSGGYYACTLLFMRKWLGDRLFDKAVMSIVKAN